MAEPVGRGLRAARRSGLTSPEPVRTSDGPSGHPETPDPGPGNLWTSRRTVSGRENTPKTTRGGQSPKPPHSAFNRWIEAKVTDGWRAEPVMCMPALA